ncbi:hypothetical protein E2C01_076681 [Portunus trituberculatus]|nr:hypothetical protein [Portunus trituberculatus]
MDVDPV